MIQSFLVYGIFAFLLFWLGTISDKRERFYLKRGIKPHFLKWDIVFAIFIFAFISGIRWNVGTDHLNYLLLYKDILKTHHYWQSDVEPGFYFISRIFASLNIHFTIYFAFWAFLQIFFIYYSFKEERYLLPFLGLVIVTGMQYLLWMNGIRHILAACIFVFSIQFIHNRKFIKYFFTILLATLFHKSAIILLIFYFIPNIDYFKNRYLAIFFLIASIIIGSSPHWLSATDEVRKVLLFIGYDKYSRNLANYIEDTQQMGFGPRRIITQLLSVSIIWFSPILKERFKNTSFLLYYNLTLIGAFYFNIFANTGVIFLRPAYYFIIFSSVTTSYLLYYLKSLTPKAFSLRYLFVFILAISYIGVAIVAESGSDRDHTNFKFFWDFLD